MILKLIRWHLTLESKQWEKDLLLQSVCVWETHMEGRQRGWVYTLGALSPKESKRPGRRMGPCSGSWKPFLSEHPGQEDQPSHLGHWGAPQPLHGCRCEVSKNFSLVFYVTLREPEDLNHQGNKFTISTVTKQKEKCLSFSSFCSCQVSIRNLFNVTIRSEQKETSKRSIWGILHFSLNP